MAPRRGRQGGVLEMLSSLFAETAVNIGFACQLLTDDMLILEARDIK